jgi:hypothetical protein
MEMSETHERTVSRIETFGEVVQSHRHWYIQVWSYTVMHAALIQQSLAVALRSKGGESSRRLENYFPLSPRHA